MPARAWLPAVDAAGDLRDGGDVVEVTDLLDPAITTRWPAGMRVIVRRERPTPGRSCHCSKRPTGGGTEPWPPTRGPVSWRSSKPGTGPTRASKTGSGTPKSGLGRFPSREFAINQAWLQVVTLAADLTAWLRLLALPDTLKTCEPKALRYRLLHVPARLTRSGRQRRLRLPRSWPWAAQLKAVFDSITAIPAPT